MKPWSYSTLTASELCPKKYAAEKVHKSVAEKKNEMAGYGTDGHKFFEHRMKAGTELPMDMQHHEPELARIARLNGSVSTEQWVALNTKLQPCGPFDDGVWVRGKIDLIVNMAPRALIVDWKFGKMQTGWDQLDLMAAQTFAILPTIQAVVGAFYWARNNKEERWVRKPYTRADAAGIWRGFLPRVQEFQRRHDENDFPAKPNFLCQKYCPVTGCRFHGENHRNG